MQTFRHINIESQYIIDGELYRVTAERRDRFYGNGLKLSIYKSSGELWATSICNCHIEFEGFNECQQLSTNELLSLAIKKLSSDWHHSIKESKQIGLGVYGRLNGNGSNS